MDSRHWTARHGSEGWVQKLECKHRNSLFKGCLCAKLQETPGIAGCSIFFNRHIWKRNGKMGIRIFFIMSNCLWTGSVHKLILSLEPEIHSRLPNLDLTKQLSRETRIRLRPGKHVFALWVAWPCQEDISHPKWPLALVMLYFSSQWMFDLIVRCDSDTL